MNKHCQNLELAIKRIKKAHSTLALFVSGDASIQVRADLQMALEYLKSSDTAASDEAESQAHGDCESRPGHEVRE